MNISLYKSDKPKKKYYVVIDKQDGKRTKKIYFGDSSYEDYTQHHDKQRREQYRSRHSGDNIHDYNSAGFWSWHVLWGDSTNILTNFKKVKLN